jgi:hypothetical protein
MKTGSAIVLVFAIWFGWSRYDQSKREEAARRDQRQKAWADCMNSYPHDEYVPMQQWLAAQENFCAAEGK